MVGTVLLGDEGEHERPDFKIFTGELKVVKSSASSDGRKRVRGIASSSVKDLHGDRMTDACVRSMTKQIVGKTIFLNHNYKLPEDVFGVAEKARTRTMSAAEAKAQGYIDKSAPNDPITLMDITVLEDSSNPRAEATFASMENGVTVGISIGALITDFEEDPDYEGDYWAPLIINEVILLEASMVGIPANPLSWVENATKGLIQKGAVRGASEDQFNRMRQKWLSFSKKEASVDPEEDLDLANTEVDDETEEPPTVVAEVPEPGEPPEPDDDEDGVFQADGPDQIIAHYQIQVEAGKASRTDLDAMEEAVQASIDYALEHGVAASEFEGRTAKDMASEILNSEPAPDPPDSASEEADPTDDQEAPPASDPEGDAGVDGEAEKEAEAQIRALQAEGVLNGLTETVRVLGETLATLIAERAKTAELTAKNEALTTKLAEADKNVATAVEIVNRLMSMPVGRKSVVRREAAGLAERLKGGPYSGELLAYIAKHNQGASDAP